jgi:aspartate aminotransferase-like enzyme
MIVGGGLAEPERHRLLGRACGRAPSDGLELFSPDDETAAVVTAIKAPDGVDATELVSQLRDRYGVQLATARRT